MAAEAAYTVALDEKTADAEGKFSSRPDLVALVWGASALPTVPAGSPPTFLVGSTHAADGMGNTIELWNKLRGDPRFQALCAEPAATAATPEVKR